MLKIIPKNIRIEYLTYLSHRERNDSHMQIISVRNVSKVYQVNPSYDNIKAYMKNIFMGKKKEINGVTDISFDIGKGEIVGYLGPNGAGKSTTIKMLTGILVPSEGQIIVNGLNPHKNRKEYVKTIGVVFGQRSQLWWDIPVRDTFELLKDIYKIPPQKYKQNLDLFCEVLEIEKIISRPVRQLSLGQRMRCEIAASFLHNPDIVYLDEPTVGLDIIAKEKIRNIIKFLSKEKKTTIILTTHDLSDIEELCERIVLIDKGSLVYDGSIKKIKNIYGSTKTISVGFSEDIKLNIPNTTMIKEKGMYKKFSFDCSTTSMQSIMNILAASNKLVDVEIQGTPIEDIIRRIYVDGMKDIG